ncbi:RNA-dependent RNA polymerase [Colletotrichum plurivorum]|uniref:RNA-dependent RNA polymerase n=1 Tax=Colletotrichum plurivorum TaxID=2175906 RepID=A0A8H6KNE6_9PEZI|nr:RNA-dependent RNA polymerase [Colletotrichum plurivorum]
MRTPPVGHPLRSLRNCIAFSQFGKRDLHSQLSGGDLDGDLYNIIWDRAAIPKRVYTAAIIPVLHRSLLADRWRDTIWPDDPDGTVGVDCIALSSLHSTAVDFSKTGIPVTQKEIPKVPRFRPDFLAPAPLHISEDDEDMAGPNHQYYKWEKILGTLYRNVDEKQIWDEDISRVVSKRGPSVWDQFVGLMQRKIEDYTHGTVSWKTRRADAKRLRDLYEDTVMGAMNQYSDNFMLPLTEVEVFCGSIFNKSGSQTRRQKDNSKKLKAEFDRLSEWLVMQMRRKHRPAENPEYGTAGVNGSAATEDDSATRVPIANREALEMSYACLMVGLVQNHDVDYEHRADLQSFKVIAASVLLKELTELANRARGGHGQMVAPTSADDGDVGGGGYVGVSSGPGAAYAYNGYDVDVGQYPNYGYTQYI